MNIEEAITKYLAMSPKTEKQVRDYLTKKEFPTERIEEEINQAKEFRYIDDRNYAETFFRIEYEKGRGKMYIAAALKKKGVDPQVIEEGYKDYMDSDEGQSTDERKIALHQAMLLVTDKEIDQKLKAKIARRLAARGFATDTIYYVLGNLGHSSDDFDD